MVGLKVDLPPFHRSSKQTRTREDLELPLNGALRCAGMADDLAQVELLIGVSKEPSQHPPPRLTEQHGAWLREWFAARTHNGYDRTRSECDLKPARAAEGTARRSDAGSWRADRAVLASVRVREPQLPSNTGARFSRKARICSWPSGDTAEAAITSIA